MVDDDVVVVGAGPVGLTAALGLAQRGLRVRILEREAAIGTAPRAIIHYGFTLPGLAQLGVLDELVERALVCGDLTAVLWESLDSFPLSLRFEGAAFPFTISLGQDELAAVLLEHLGRLANVEVELGAGVTGLSQDDSGVRLEVETAGGRRQVRAGWAIGCDGADSAVRKLAGLDFEGMTWPDRFIATNIATEPPAPWTDANFSIDLVYGAVFVRIGRTGLWRCTYRESGDLPVETYRERIPDFLDTFLRGDDYEVDASAPYRMHQRSAQTYRAGRVLLAGDAAHITNPTLGQGLTSGLHDAFAVSHCLADVIDGQRPASRLDEYAEVRRAAFHEVHSPLAVGAKQLLFDGGISPAIHAQELAGLRAVAGDPEWAASAGRRLAAGASDHLTAWGDRMELTR